VRRVHGWGRETSLSSCLLDLLGCSPRLRGPSGGDSPACFAARDACASGSSRADFSTCFGIPCGTPRPLPSVVAHLIEETTTPFPEASVRTKRGWAWFPPTTGSPEPTEVVETAAIVDSIATLADWTPPCPVTPVGHPSPTFEGIASFNGPVFDTLRCPFGSRGTLKRGASRSRLVPRN
jgi:hypothetical protein